MSRFIEAGKTFLPGMSSDTYFPPAEVAKLRALLEQLVGWLEAGSHSTDDVQVKCDRLCESINALQEDFEAAGSEIETGAREDICGTVAEILQVYGITLEIEEAMRNREW